MIFSASHYSSPLGEVLLIASAAGLSGCYFTGQRYFPNINLVWRWDDAPFADTKRVLTAYFQKADSPSSWHFVKYLSTLSTQLLW